MNKCLIMGLLAFTLCACQKQKAEEQEGPKPADLAAAAGKAYYDHLLGGQVDSFVVGIDGTQHATPDYRQMLTASTKLFIERQDSLHKGIKKAEVDSTAFSAVDSTARVFLRLTYGDGSKERILLPMLCRRGHWYMR